VVGHDAGVLTPLRSAIPPQWLQRWLPRSRSGIGRVPTTNDHLLGVTSPSAQLPITFPASVEDPPFRPLSRGGRQGRLRRGTRVGHLHYAASGIDPLFGFGHGPAYSSFRHDPPVVAAGARRRFRRGPRCGRRRPPLCALRLVAREPAQGLTTVELVPGETATVRFALDSRGLRPFGFGRRGGRPAAVSSRSSLAPRRVTSVTR